MEKKHIMNFFTFFVSLCLMACSERTSSNPPENTIAEELMAEVVVVEKATVISEAEFKQLVMNYEANPEKWVFEGKMPCIVDFYADWCGPCRRIAPILDDLAKTYSGKVNIYKVNVDQSRFLSGYFGIRSIPTMLFCPLSGQPALQPGGLAREQLVDVIENFLLKKTE